MRNKKRISIQKYFRIIWIFMLPFVISLERGKNSDTMGKGLLSSGNINSDFRIKFFFFPLLSPLSRKIPFFIEISLKKKKKKCLSPSIHSFQRRKLCYVIRNFIWNSTKLTANLWKSIHKNTKFSLVPYDL